MIKFLNRPREHWALLHDTDATNTSLAVFVHGFRGGYLGTWGGLAPMLSQNAGSHKIFSEWDYAFLGYNTRNVETYLDIAKLVSSEWDRAQTGSAPYAHSYRRLALFGHSLGTLGIRQLLCACSIQPGGMSGAIQSVTLFGSPLNGSHLAWLAFYKIGEALYPGNPQLRMLRSWAKCAYSAHAWPGARVIFGLDDKVVGFVDSDLVDWPGDRRPLRQTNLDHRHLVKPD